MHFLKEFGLLEKKNCFPNSLSGGEKQRVALARVLITKPKALLMDEPFSNLDINLRKEICNYTLETLKKNNIPVIFVTHDVEEAMSVSDRIIVMKKGKILQIDTPKKLYKSPNNKCVAANKDGPLYKTDTNGKPLDIDYFYYKIKTIINELGIIYCSFN